MKAVFALLCTFCSMLIAVQADDLVLKDFHDLKNWKAWRGGKISGGEENSIVLALPGTVEFADLRLLEKGHPNYSLKAYPMPSLKSIVQKMAKGEKVLIYCHGDSITAGMLVGEKRYPVLLEKMLREHFKNNNITVKTIAVDGAKTTDLRMTAEADFTGGETPNLVTFTLGFNDKTLALREFNVTAHPNSQGHEMMAKNLLKYLLEN